MSVAAGDRMTQSGFCAWPSPGSHKFCRQRQLSCDCPCHIDPEKYEDGHEIGFTAARPQHVDDD